MVRDPELSAAALQSAYGAKAAAEIEDAEVVLRSGSGVRGGGDPLATTVLLKGAAGPDDVALGRALAGADGEAARKALAALGHDAASVYAACTRAGDASPQARARAVERLVEAVDPALVIALDAEAAEDLGAAFCVQVRPNGPVSARGRILGAVGGLEASLADESEKARVWAQFKAIGKAVGVKEKGAVKAPRTDKDR
jgi:hypothetical protein